MVLVEEANEDASPNRKIIALTFIPRYASGSMLDDG